jgi:hypothetical protein
MATKTRGSNYENILTAVMPVCPQTTFMYFFHLFRLEHIVTTGKILGKGTEEGVLRRY